MNFEIFDKWWEYFTVIFWGISNPENEKIMGEKNVSKAEIHEKYADSFKKILSGKDTNKIDNLIKIIDEEYAGEEERKKTIENKAHSLIGQTSVAVTLLLAMISIITTQLNFLPLSPRIILWLLFFVIILNFITVGLLARNAVILKDGYAQYSIDFFLNKEKSQLDYLLEKYFCSCYNSYLNNVKGSYLKFAHWYFKFSFIITIVIALLLPPALMFFNIPKDNKSQEINYFYFNYNNADSLIKFNKIIDLTIHNGNSKN